MNNSKTLSVLFTFVFILESQGLLFQPSRDFIDLRFCVILADCDLISEAELRLKHLLGVLCFLLCIKVLVLLKQDGIPLS